MSILKLIAGYLFDCLVFPLSLFFLLLWLTRLAVSCLGGYAQQSEMLKLEHKLVGLLRTRQNDE